MLGWQSTISCYKTSLGLFLVLTLAAIYALRPPGEWVRHLTVVDVLRNRSAAILSVVLGSLRSCSNGSAAVLDLISFYLISSNLISSELN